ncbi:MAG: hypothetical protein ACLSFK_02990 [Streptococcus salivarius]
MQNTIVPGIYALGDVTGEKGVDSVAIKAGRTLSERLFNGKVDAKMDYTSIPTVVFSHPAIGTVALSTERKPYKLMEKRILKVYTSQFASMYTAVTQHRQQQNSNSSLLVPKKGSLAFMVLDTEVDEMIKRFAVAIKMGATKPISMQLSPLPNRIRRIRRT